MNRSVRVLAGFLRDFEREAGFAAATRFVRANGDVIAFARPNPRPANGGVRCR